MRRGARSISYNRPRTSRPDILESRSARRDPRPCSHLVNVMGCPGASLYSGMTPGCNVQVLQRAAVGLPATTPVPWSARRTTFLFTAAASYQPSALRRHERDIFRRSHHAFRPHATLCDFDPLSGAAGLRRPAAPILAAARHQALPAVADQRDPVWYHLFDRSDAGRSW